MIAGFIERTPSTSQGENKGNNNLIKKSQHGFTKGNSCLTNDNGISKAVIKTADIGRETSNLPGFLCKPMHRALSPLPNHPFGAWYKDEK